MHASRSWMQRIKFAGQSLWKALSWLGIVGKTRHKIDICEMDQAAEEASRWLWMRRDEEQRWKAHHSQGSDQS
jgi:hypothetical protein